MRALAVSGAERVEGFDAPTAKEAGLDVELENWRGFVAPADTRRQRQGGADRRGRRRCTTSQAWKDEMAENGWDDAYQPADEFATYLAEEKTRIQGVLAELGLV